jgi:hypothetical protein
MPFSSGGIFFPLHRENLFFSSFLTLLPGGIFFSDAGPCPDV